MVEERQDELITRQRAHFDAARRQRDAALAYPEASRGFLRSARFHIARAGTLAAEICSGAAPDPGRSIGAALPFSADTGLERRHTR
jgi:hypothetical protein